MYLGSKYEDIYPLHSRTVVEKISHSAFTKEQLFKKEEEILRLFEFSVDFVTSYDIHQSMMALISAKVGKNQDTLLGKVSELSMLYIRMALQSPDFL